MKIHKLNSNQPQKHLTEAQLLRYQEGTMTDAEMHEVEQHLLDCELCNDAVDGFELLEPQQSVAALADLKGRLEHRIASEATTKPRFIFWQWGAAASVVLIMSLVAYLLINNFSRLQNTAHSDKEIVPETTTRPNQSQDPVAVIPLPESTNENLAEPDWNAPLAEKPAAPAPEKETNSSRKAEELSEVADEVAVEELEPIVLAAPEEEKETEHADSSSTVKYESVEKALEGKAAGVAVEKQITIRGNFSAPKPMPYKETLVRGIVKDRDGYPLPGANVLIKGTTQGVVTDINGQFQIAVSAPDAVLLVSFIGYQPEELKVEEPFIALNVVLNEDTQTLSEVVVVGYGTTTKRDMTGSVTSVDFRNSRPEIGTRKFKKYVKENTRYPVAAKENKVKGRVIIEGYVNPDGSLTELKVVKSLGYGLDEEALRLIKEGPSWKPATSDGKSVRQKIRIKVRFNAAK